jgi:hypothetical protein
LIHFKIVRPLHVFLLALVFSLASAHLALANEKLTQRDWMVTLVDTLGLSFGLPDEPQDPDYINLLFGTRSFRFEAETVYSPEEDEVSTMTFNNFGAFSGEGWLQGLNVPSDVHLRFVLPLAGTYQLYAAVRNGEHDFNIEQEQWHVKSEERFTRVNIGEVTLSAGPQEVLVTLAPGGAIDYIELLAPALKPIMPRAGWDPDEILQWEDIETTLLQVFDLAGMLPFQQAPEVFEVESGFSQEESNASVVDIAHFGSPSGGKWVRASSEKTELTIPIDLRQNGFYLVTLRIMGQPIRVSLNNHSTTFIQAEQYLEDYPLGVLYFYSGINNLQLSLPIGGGIDQITLMPIEHSEETVATLLGFTAGERNMTEQLFNHLTNLLAAFGDSR